MSGCFILRPSVVLAVLSIEEQEVDCHPSQY